MVMDVYFVGESHDGKWRFSYSKSREVLEIVVHGKKWSIKDQSLVNLLIEALDMAMKITTKATITELAWPRHGDRIWLYGNWITNTQFVQYGNKNLILIPEAHTDMRDDPRMFVLLAPVVEKDAVLVEVNNHGSGTLTLKGGTKLTTTLIDWEPYRLENHMAAVLQCQACGVNGHIQHMNMRYIHNRLMCGPCLDKAQERGELNMAVMEG